MNTAELKARVQALLSMDPEAPDLVLHIDRELAEIAPLRDPAVIPILLPLFRDTSDHTAMFSVIHTIEVFETPVYVEGILTGLVGFGRSAPYWASIVIMRLLNDDVGRHELARQVAQADPEVREMMAALLHAINAQSETFKPKTQPVLFAASLQSPALTPPDAD